MGADGGGALELLHHSPGIVRSRRAQRRVEILGRGCAANQGEQALERGDRRPRRVQIC